MTYHPCSYELSPPLIDHCECHVRTRDTDDRYRAIFYMNLQPEGGPPADDRMSWDIGIHICEETWELVNLPKR